MKYRVCDWAVETLADCMTGLDAHNLHELIASIKDEPAGTIAAVLEKLETDLERRVEDEDLCPECYQPGKQHKTVRCFSDGWSEPPGSWDEPGGEYCSYCGWEEK